MKAKTVGDRRRTVAGYGHRPARFWRALRQAWLGDAVAVGNSELLSPRGAVGRRDRRRLVLDHALPLAFYLLVTIVFTYPLILHLTTRLPGAYSDGWQNYWNLWWLRKALAEGRSPFWTPLIYAPYGAPLYLHTLIVFDGLVTLPVQALFGVTAAYNAVVFISFTLSGYFAYLLVAYISGNRVAGLAGGLIYAFGSYHATQLIMEHPNLFSSEWLPAYILCLLQAQAATGRRRTISIVGCAVTFLLLTLCDWQYTVFAVLFTIVYTVYATVARRSFTPLLLAAAVGGLATIATLPLLAPALAELRSGRVNVRFYYLPADFSADLLSFVVPSPLHRWWGAWAARVGQGAVSPLYERSVFLGWLPLLLALIGLCRDRLARFWAVAAVFFGVLALGPYLHVGGQSRFGAGGWQIPLPYLVLQQIPGLNISRVPARFAFLVTLCLAVLAGLGIAALARQWSRRIGRRRWSVVAVGLLVLLVAEHVVAPIPLKRVEAPPFYQQLAASSEAGTVLEWPFYLQRARSLYYQTVHTRPLIGGYLSRPLSYPLTELPPVRESAGDAPDIVIGDAADAVEAGRWALRFFDVRWIVVLLDDPRLDREGLPRFLARYALPDPIYQDELMAVYRPRPPSSPRAPLFLGVQGAAGGWYEREALPDKKLMRWFSAEARFSVWNLTDAPESSVFSFEAWSFGTPRRLEVRLDDRVVGQWTVSPRQTYTVPLTLTPGEHRVTLRSLDPPAAPAALGGGSDTRALAIGVASVELRR